MPRKATTPDAEAVLESAVSDTAPVRRVRRTAPRKRVAETVSDNASGDESVAGGEKRVVRRKAPVRRVAAAAPEVVASPVTSGSGAVSLPRQSRLRRNRGVVIVVMLLLMVGVGVSAALGMSDRGVIDVTARMNEQSQLQAKIAGENGESTTYTVPVQNTQVVDVPNGGLRGRGIGSEPTPPPTPTVENASSTATTTDATTSSSTEAVDTPEVEQQSAVPTDSAVAS